MEASTFLKQNNTQYRDILMKNIDCAIDRVFEEKLLVHFEYTNLKSFPPFDAATGLVDKMIHKGETTCRKFLHLLQDAQLMDKFPDLRTLPPYSPPATPSTDPPTSCDDKDIHTEAVAQAALAKPKEEKMPLPTHVQSPIETRTPPASLSSTSHFVDYHRPSLIARVSMVDPILDLLFEEEVITNEHYSVVRSKPTSSDQMRELYRILQSKGPKAKDSFYRALEKSDIHLLNDLPPPPPPPADKGTGARSSPPPPGDKGTQGRRETTSGDRAKAVNTFGKSVTPKVHKEGWHYVYSVNLPAAGIFQCSTTGVGFTATGEGDLVYRIVQWDEGRLQSTRRTPGGNLFSIESPKESISQLHLPHCDTVTPGDLTVAHITDEGMRLVKPLEVTATHVVVNATQGVYGILKRIEKSLNPTGGQVHLFLMRPGSRRQILNVILTPGNVPIKEAQRQHAEDTHIMTISDCNNLLPNQKYSLQSSSYKVQPKAATFYLNYGPNYHPTFQVTFDLNPEEFTLELVHIGSGNNVVWRQDIDLGALPLAAGAYVPALPPSTTAESVPGGHFVDQHRLSLIKRVKMVDSILDMLLSEHVISEPGYEQVRSKPTTMAKMRELYTLLNATGPKAKDVFYRGLEKNERMLLDDLKH